MVHLHGGGLRERIFERFRVLRLLNRWAYKRVDKVIVLGESLVHIFDGIAAPSKIEIVSNFAPRGGNGDPKCIPYGLDSYDRLGHIGGELLGGFGREGSGALRIRGRAALFVLGPEAEVHAQGQGSENDDEG